MPPSKVEEMLKIEITGSTAGRERTGVMIHGNVAFVDHFDELVDGMDAECEGRLLRLN